MERAAQLRERGCTPLSVRTGISEAEGERVVYGATGRMNRTTRSTRTARRPFDAWNPVERETNSRQSCNMSLTRLASRGALWSFIFIPRIRSCRFLVALKTPGHNGHSTNACEVNRPGAACSPTRSGLPFRRRFRSRFLLSFCRNRPVVTSSTAVPTLTQRAGHLERNRGAARVPAMPVRPGPGLDTQNVSKLIYVFSQAL